MWELYQQAAAVGSTRPVCYSMFTSIWRQLLPHLVVMKPMSDLCWLCQQNSTAINRSANLTQLRSQSTSSSLPLGSLVHHHLQRSHRALAPSQHTTHSTWPSRCSTLERPPPAGSQGPQGNVPSLECAAKPYHAKSTTSLMRRLTWARVLMRW